MKYKINIQMNFFDLFIFDLFTFFFEFIYYRKLWAVHQLIKQEDPQLYL